METLYVRTITPEQARPIRSAILRPGYPSSYSIYPGDDNPDTFHAGAFIGDHLVGIATVFHENFPQLNLADGWRLRGMAVIPEYQRKGVGKALIDACLSYLLKIQGGMIWCNARLDAMPFYRAMGFQTLGEVFDIPESGPHTIAWREI